MVSGIVPGLAGDVRHLRPGWRTSRPVTEPIMTDDRADPRRGCLAASIACEFHQSPAKKFRPVFLHLHRIFVF